METITKFCLQGPCCSPFEDYSSHAMAQIDKALGNIINSNKEISFVALINQKLGKAKIVSYLFSDNFQYELPCD